MCGSLYNGSPPRTHEIPPMGIHQLDTFDGVHRYAEDGLSPTFAARDSDEEHFQLDVEPELFRVFDRNRRTFGVDPTETATDGPGESDAGGVRQPRKAPLALLRHLQ